MDLHPSGKTAVVTGASKGIGLAITKALVEAGAHVVAGSRSKGSDLAELEDTGQVSFVPVDLAQPDACGELVGAAAHRGGIDVLVNNVGAVGIRPGGFASITDDEWQASWNLNAKALSKELGPKNIRVNSVSRAGVDRSVDGRGRSGRRVRHRHRANRRPDNGRDHDQHADRQVHHAAAGRRARRLPRQRPLGEHHRIRLRIDGGFITTL